MKDLEDVSVDRATAGGGVVFADGSFSKDASKCQFPEDVVHTVETDKVAADDFRIEAWREDAAQKALPKALSPR